MDNYKVITCYGNTSEIDKIVENAREKAIEFQNTMIEKLKENKESFNIKSTNTSVQHFENGKSFFSIIIGYSTSKQPRISKF